MTNKLVPPKLDPLDELPAAPAAPDDKRPDLRIAARRPKPIVESLLAQGFVTEVPASGACRTGRCARKGSRLKCRDASREPCTAKSRRAAMIPESAG